ncbi:sigma-70 family RNA polymerase sigma factor [Candidatus Accumulibacter vicinus]|uniref:RNA polymerase sigma factor n=1 Tax=Candidatus Accumulibacter vicinus TaxID=2954382 RepID=A0A084Y090_9PROT|nr:sigma-70 family RNA polymerase sigma factor [Candidatus Accumulibacter vicinus]KFB68134.1 MAG: RNA polymerase sigma factor [Candidatus Accumulibacter vicinus]
MDDLAAMRALADGNADARKAAMAAIYQRHFDRLMRHVRLRNPKLPEEAVADFVTQAFIKVFSRSGGYRGECSLFTWLARCVTNLIIDDHRHNSALQMVSIDESEEAAIAQSMLPADEEPLDAAIRGEFIDCVRRHFRTFRHRHPQAAWALWARLVEQSDVQEIADMLDKTPGATRQYLCDSARRLRQALAVCREYMLGE